MNDLICKFEDNYRFVKTKLLFLSIACTLCLGCTKGKLESKPKLTLKELKVLLITCLSSQGSVVEIDMEVADKEGDVKDSIFIQKVDASGNPCPDNSILSNLDYKIPDYPIGNTQKILFRLKFATISCPGYALIGGSQCLPAKDTSLFKIWVKDLAGNVSDTLITEPVAIP
jgi:hypothetical protein